MATQKNKSEKEIALEIMRKNLKKAVEVLVGLLESKNEEVRLQAAIVIIERILGKPVQVIKVKQVETST